MKLGDLRHASVLVALLAACGGGGSGCESCASCSGHAAADDGGAGAATNDPGAQDPAIDAARPFEEDRVRADAGPGVHLAPTADVVVLALSAVPRPQPPKSMPMGPFQSCGVYDGPVCEKTCPAGNCRQDCDGVDCILNCQGGYCSQLCGPSAKCQLTCSGGHCTQVCSKPEECTKTCAGGACQ
jgi:hypothetical protein